MPSRTYKFLTPEMLSYIDNTVKSTHAGLQDTSIVMTRNSIKKVYDLMKIDPRQYIINANESIDEVANLLAEQIHVIHKPSKQYINQNTKRILKFYEQVKKDIAYSNKTDAERAYDNYINSDQAKQDFIAKFQNVKQELQPDNNNKRLLEHEVEEDNNDDEDDVNSEEETEQIIKNQNKKRKTL